MLVDGTLNLGLLFLELPKDLVKGGVHEVLTVRGLVEVDGLLDKILKRLELLLECLEGVEEGVVDELCAGVAACSECRHKVGQALDELIDHNTVLERPTAGLELLRDALEVRNTAETR